MQNLDTLSSSSSSLSKKMNPLASLQGQLKKGEDELSQLEGLMNSPLGLFAPTPANTPQVMNISCICSNGLASETLSGVQECFDIPQVKIFEHGLEEETYKPKESLINQTLLLDLPDDCSAGLPVLKDQEESDCQEKVNGNILEEEEEDGRKVGGLDGELCKGFSKINLKEKRIPEFVSKHTRFIYSSHDEIEEEKEGDEEEGEDADHYDEDHEFDDNDDDDDDDDVGEDGGLYKGLSKKRLKEKKKLEFMGKHTRFIYNSDNEFEGEEDVTECSVLPTHALRETSVLFQEVEED